MTAKVAVLINPGAGRGKGKGLALASRLQGAKGINVRVLEDFEKLKPAVRDLASQGVSRLYVSAGDGTVDAVLTILAESRYVTPDLQLCLLPHGTTNMTAKDTGLRLNSVSSQADFILGGKVRETAQRYTLRIANAGDGQVRHGMFLGAGAVSEAARYSQRVLNERGIGGNVAPFMVLAKATLKTLLAAPNPADASRLDRPHQIAVEMDRKQICNGTHLLAIFTTLSTLILGSRPYWGDGDGPIKGTVLPYPFPNLLRWIVPVMFGGEKRKVPAGAKSGRCREATVSCSLPYILDGEFFEGPSNEPLRIETGTLFTYIRA